MVFSWILNAFDFTMGISWTLNLEGGREGERWNALLKGIFHMKKPLINTIKNLLKLHEKLVIFLLNHSQDSSGFRLHSYSAFAVK